MVSILREADRRPVPEVAKQHGVSAQTIYSWRKHFGTLDPADVQRLRQLEQENGRLKKIVADRASANGSNPAISGHRKPGHFRRPETGVEYYFTASCVRKSVWTLVRQLRGPHFSTCA